MYPRRRTYPHEKAMGSYELFAWRDAMALACLLEEDFDVQAVRIAFDAMQIGQKIDFEDKNCEIIEELIRRSESQRPAYVRKVGKSADEITRGLLIVFAILGQVRVMEILELRDRYRLALAPGSGNRITCSSLYAFQQEMAGLQTYDWPDHVFDAYGGDGGWIDPENDDA